MAERKQVGAGWMKQTDKGEYIALSFKAEEIQGLNLAQCWVSLSVNSRKSKETHPDYLIWASPKVDQQQPAPKPQQAKPSAFPKPKNFAPRSSGQGWDEGDPGY